MYKDYLLPLTTIIYPYNIKDILHSYDLRNTRRNTGKIKKIRDISQLIFNACSAQGGARIKLLF